MNITTINRVVVLKPVQLLYHYIKFGYYVCYVSHLF
jgi:hypothetical protein